MRALLFIILGAVTYHLWANADDRARLTYTVQEGVYTAADGVAQAAKPSWADRLSNR